MLQVLVEFTHFIMEVIMEITEATVTTFLADLQLLLIIQEIITQDQGGVMIMLMEEVLIEPFQFHQTEV
jgi:hypothetical protein